MGVSEVLGMISGEEMTMIASFVNRKFDSFLVKRQNDRVLQLYPKDSIRSDIDSYVDPIREEMAAEFPEYELSVYRLIEGPIEITGV